MMNLKSQEHQKNMTGLCENNESLNVWLDEIAKITSLTSGYAKVCN